MSSMGVQLKQDGLARGESHIAVKSMVSAAAGFVIIVIKKEAAGILSF